MGARDGGHRVAKWLAAKMVPAVWGSSLTAHGKWEKRELSFETLKALYDTGVHFAPQTEGWEHDSVPIHMRGTRVSRQVALRGGA